MTFQTRVPVVCLIGIAICSEDGVFTKSQLKFVNKDHFMLTYTVLGLLFETQSMKYLKNYLLVGLL
jgi:hypothetical protein